nr:hypothetical protein CFP56_67375 [Quercus suber]
MASSNDESPWTTAVDAVRRYYTFLANELGAIPPNCIVEPPEEGWSSITQNSLAGLEKSEAVIELLRHLPYIERSKDYNTQIAFGTSAIDYRKIGEFKVAEGKRSQFIPLGNEEFPPHVAVLTDEGEDYYGSLLLVDTEKEISLFGMDGRSVQCRRWHDASVRPRDRFRQIYRDHGWPDNFRREECRNALQEWNMTIDDRLSQPGNNLHEITRQPPGPHDYQNGSHGEDYDAEDED